MQTKIKVLIIVILLSTNIQAQDWQWIRDGGSVDTLNPNWVNDEQVIDMVTDSQRNVYVISPVGLADLNIDGNPKINWGDYPNPVDFALASFTCDGTYRWSKIIGGAGIEYLKSVQVDSQDNIYIAGRFQGVQSTSFPPRIDDDFIMEGGPTYQRKMFIAKFNSDGVFQWIRRPEPNDINNSSFELIIDETDTLHWFVFIEPGIYADGAFTNTLEGHNLFAFTYDVNGNFLNTTHIQGFEPLTSFKFKIYRNPYNNNYYMLYRKVQTTGTVNVNGTTITGTTFIASWDENGVFKWLTENSSDTVGSLSIHDLEFDPNNNIYLCGRIAGLHLDSFLGFSVAETITPYFLLKTNPTADTLLWSTYCSENVHAGGGGLVYNDTEIGLVTASGGTNFVWGTETLNINPAGAAFDVVFARFNTQTGETLSLDRLVGDDGNQDLGTKIITDNNNDYLIGGGFGHYIYDAFGNQNINAGGSTDFFVAKYATEACETVSVEDLEDFGLQLYPNPVQNTLTITARENIKNIRIINVLGQEVLVARPLSLETTVDLSKLHSGTYFVRVQVGGIVGSYTIVKE